MQGQEGSNTHEANATGEGMEPRSECTTVFITDNGNAFSLNESGKKIIDNNYNEDW